MSNKLIFLLILAIAITACKEEKKSSFENSVNSLDTACLNEIIRAKTDLKNKKLVYCGYIGNIAWQALRAESEMRGLLKQKDIEYKNESSPCIVENNRNYHCYCEFMQEKINERFGTKFTDSLLYLADSLWILKNRDKVFDCGSESSCWDIPAKFPGDSTNDQTNHSGLQKAFEKRVKYPTDYRVQNGKNSLALLQFYIDIDETGKAKVTDTYFVFWDDKTKEEDFNKKYWNYLKNIAVPLIEKTTWTPAKIKSIGVKSKNDIFIHLK